MTKTIKKKKRYDNKNKAKKKNYIIYICLIFIFEKV